MNTTAEALAMLLARAIELEAKAVAPVVEGRPFAGAEYDAAAEQEELAAALGASTEPGVDPEVDAEAGDDLAWVDDWVAEHADSPADEEEKGYDFDGLDGLDADPAEAKGVDFDDLDDDEPVSAEWKDDEEADLEVKGADEAADTISEFELLLARRAELDG